VHRAVPRPVRAARRPVLRARRADSRHRLGIGGGCPRCRVAPSPSPRHVGSARRVGCAGGVGAARRVGAAVGAGAGGRAGLDDPAAATEEIQRRREEIGFSYFVFGADSADTLAPVVAELAGHWARMVSSRFLGADGLESATQRAQISRSDAPRPDRPTPDDVVRMSLSPCAWSNGGAGEGRARRRARPGRTACRRRSRRSRWRRGWCHEATGRG
jgi:hypothetical protein